MGNLTRAIILACKLGILFTIALAVVIAWRFYNLGHL